MAGADRSPQVTPEPMRKAGAGVAGAGGAGETERTVRPTTEGTLCGRRQTSMNDGHSLCDTLVGSSRVWMPPCGDRIDPCMDLLCIDAGCIYHDGFPPWSNGFLNALEYLAVPTVSSRCVRTAGERMRRSGESRGGMDDGAAAVVEAAAACRLSHGSHMLPSLHQGQSMSSSSTSSSPTKYLCGE